MSVPLLAAKLLVKFVVRKSRQDFAASLKDPKMHQARVLVNILSLSGKSELPARPTRYEDYPENQSWTTEPVDFFETTSGSAGLKKKVPYTRALRRSFQQMFLLWANDILENFNLSNGKLFISLSPQLRSLGMQSDLEYLNPWLQKVVNLFLITKSTDFHAENGFDFSKTVSYRLVSNPDLEVISIWSPTYFLSILDWIYVHRDQLQLSAIQRVHIDNRDWKRLWPNLRLISCWADGASEVSCRTLKENFRGVRFQSKGLLCTEAPISLPWEAASGAVPLWTEVYLEFQKASGEIVPLYEMQVGECGEILISTRGGLLRYQLGDLVRCTHIYQRSPVIEFVRRTGETSDLVGEKLDAAILRKVFKDYSFSWMLIPDQNRYIFVSSQPCTANEVESRLGQIYHYALARSLGQLGEIETLFISNLDLKYQVFNQSVLGLKTGDIKARSLWSNSQFLQTLRNQKLVGPFESPSMASN